jgi:outer membrane protein assembly factor BamE
MTAFTMRTTSARIGALAALSVALLCAGCLYRMPIQQGNFLDANQVSQLQPGMTRPQVSFLLGTPMVPNGFNNDRWDYYYYIKVGRRASGTESKRLTVWFQDDKVDHVDRSDAPIANEQAAAAAKAQAAEPGAARGVVPPAKAPATAAPAGGTPATAAPAGGTPATDTPATTP